MVFKLIILSALLAAVNGGYLAPVVTKVASPAYDAVATTHQNVVRSFAGTVSQYSKSVHAPHSSVHKEDTRVNNNVYSPAFAKTVSYATPAVAKTVSYAPAPVYSAILTPAAAKPLRSHQQPKQVVYVPYGSHRDYTYEQPAHSIQVAPTRSAAVLPYEQQGAPSTSTTAYSQGAAATTYSHNSPAASAYGSRPTVRYSPAEMVSHTSFDGFGVHWGF